MALARDEFQHSARHSAEKIARKVSNRSLDSKCSHESSDDDLLEAHDKDGRPASTPASSPASPPPSGIELSYAPSQRGLTPVHRDAAGRHSSEDFNPLSPDGDYAKRNRSFNRTPQPSRSGGLSTPPARVQNSSADNLAILSSDS